MIGAIGSRGPFQLGKHAPRVPLVLVLLSQVGEIESEKDDSSLKMHHDREARKVAEQRMVRKNEMPMATATLGRRRPELTRYAEKFSASKKISEEMDAAGPL